MKKKMSLKFVLITMVLLPLIISALTINIRATVIVNQRGFSEIESKLHTAVEVAAKRFDEFATEGDGTYEIKNDVLYIGGSQEIASDDEFFSAALAEDIYLTLFIGDTRYGTSIRDQSGELIIGTKASDAVISEVLNGGNEKFIQHVEIAGEVFSAYYIPLKDGSGNTVGMMFAGTPYEASKQRINKDIYSLMTILFICIVLFGAVGTVIAVTVNKRVKAVADNITVIAGGDFSNPVTDNNKIKELSEISQNMESMRVRLKEAVTTIIEHAKKVEESAGVAESKIEDSRTMVSNINNAVMDLADSSSAMAGDVQNTSDLTMNIGRSVDQVLTSANTNIEKADQVYQNSIDVQQRLKHLKKEDKETDAIAGEVQESVGETAKVVEEIQNAADAIINIASQTDLLALNASIEAASAGAAGRGFAVVADSIKALSEESNKSAKEITEMLTRISALSIENKKLTQSIKEATSNESVAFDKMSVAFETMEQQLKETEEGNKQIEMLVRSVSRDKEAIIEAIESLSSISEENAAATEETSAAISQLNDNMESVVGEAKELKRIAGALEESISFFQI